MTMGPLNYGYGLGIPRGDDAKAMKWEDIIPIGAQAETKEEYEARMLREATRMQNVQSDQAETAVVSRETLPDC